MKTFVSAAVAAAAVFVSGCTGASVVQAPAISAGTGAVAQTAASRIAQPAPARLPASVAAAIVVPSSVDPAQTPAAVYCGKTGGVVEVRRAVYGSNGPSTLQLAGIADFCQYTSRKDGSRIHILLNTLYATKPTLAALAYILKPPVGSCGGNPASCYCSLLGGSDQFGGTTGAGGGWFNKKSVDQTLEACIFPDLSSIDSWGLTYHSAGIIRGKDLTKVMRYKYPGG